MNTTTTQFDQGNALECARASMLAYSTSGGLASSNPYTWVEDAATDTHLFIQEFADYVVISFRGTTSIRNWITDADCRRKCLCMQASGDVIRVHEGFLNAFDAVLPALTAALRKIVVGTRKIYVTGHSLGGALALLCAYELDRQGFNVAQVYTFGQPRVGNAAWVRMYESRLGLKTWRFVYQEDIVPRVPHLPSWHDLYRHAGTEVFVPSETIAGQFWFNPPWWRLLISDAWGIYKAWLCSKFKAALDLAYDHHVSNYVSVLQKGAA